MRGTIVRRDVLFECTSAFGALVFTAIETQTVGSVIATYSRASLLRFSCRPSGSGCPPRCGSLLCRYSPACCGGLSGGAFLCRSARRVVMVVFINITLSFGITNSLLG